MYFLIYSKLILIFLFLPVSYGGGCYSDLNGYESDDQVQHKSKKHVNKVVATCKHGLTFYKKMKLNNGLKIYFKIEAKRNSRYLLGTGGTGGVFHAYLPSEENQCLALKIAQNIVASEEIQIHEHFLNINEQEKNRIIKYYGYKDDNSKYNDRTFIALEYGGISLLEYYDLFKRQENDLFLLSNIIKGAARALAQFNQHAIHFDIKQSNFIVSEEPNSNIEDSVKIIDFHLSVLLNTSTAHNVRFDFMTKIYMAPEIRGLDIERFESGIERNISMTKTDVWSFGLMCYNLIYGLITSSISYNELDLLLEEYRKDSQHDELNRMVKACIQEQPNQRPLMRTVVRFLEKECHGFNYEKSYLTLEENQVWCVD